MTAAEHTPNGQPCSNTPSDHVVHYSRLLDTDLHRPFCTCGWTTESLAPLLMSRDAVHAHWGQMQAKHGAA